MLKAPCSLLAFVTLTACASSAPPAPSGEPIVTATPAPSASEIPAAPTSTEPVATAAPSASAAPSAPPDEVPVAPVPNKKYALVVSFFSPGNGTDREAYERLLGLIAKSPKKLAYATGHWGKEGEHDACFELTELSATEKTAFVASVKKEMAASTRVNVESNAVCKNTR